jgi:hypothetical protein
MPNEQRVLNGLLLLSRSQAGLNAREPADLAGIAAAALDAARQRARNLAVHTDLRPALVSGEPVLLERMVAADGISLAPASLRSPRPGPGVDGWHGWFSYLERGPTGGGRWVAAKSLRRDA